MSLWRMAVTHQRLRSRARPGRAIRSVLAAFGAALLLGWAGVRAEPALQVDPAQARPGGRIAARYTGYTPSSADAWIGFYRAEAADNRYISYTFLNNLDDNTYAVQAPAEAGSFNFRLFADEGYRPLAVSPAVTVVDPAAAPAKGPERGKRVRYAGRAEADGRAAELDLFFEAVSGSDNTSGMGQVITLADSKVSGRLHAQGVAGPNILLTSTDISFSNLTFTGTWEAPDGRIEGPWAGGDYAGGKLLADYPTNGLLTIRLAERGGKPVIFLHRVAGSPYGYVFPPQGKVWDASAALFDAADGAQDAGGAGNAGGLPPGSPAGGNGGI